MLLICAYITVKLLLLLLDGQECPGKTICLARLQAFENVLILIGTKNHQNVNYLNVAIVGAELGREFQRLTTLIKLKGFFQRNIKYCPSIVKARCYNYD